MHSVFVFDKCVCSISRVLRSIYREGCSCYPNGWRQRGVIAYAIEPLSVMFMSSLFLGSYFGVVSNLAHYDPSHLPQSLRGYDWLFPKKHHGSL